MVKRVAIAAALLCAGLFLLIPQQSFCDDEADKHKPRLYTWTDEKGRMNITDDIGKVPEKYRGSVQVMDQTPGGDEGAVQQPAEPMTPAPAPDDETAKEEWKARIKEWEQKLAGAQERKRSLQRERDELFRAWGSPALAPIANRQRAEAIDTEVQEVQKEIDEATHMLDEVIPEEARKAGVPPGWLRK